MRIYYGSQWGSLAAVHSLKKLYHGIQEFFYYKSHENPYLVLQVSALHASEHAMKSMVGMIKSSSP